MTARLILSDILELAKSRGGKCLSASYTNNRTKMLWECSVGHTWKAPMDRIAGGAWCPHCSGNAKKNLDFCKALAIDRNGKCLSDIYTNNSTQMLWECGIGHQWNAILGNIAKGKWCPTCGHVRTADARRHTIDEMHEIARKKGGRCLSQIYLGADKHLEWECSIGHTWMAKPGNIKHANWCPQCSEFISERICRAYFESIFGEKFPKCKTKWLRTGKRSYLELDGYCEKLGIAFEHQGEQHYVKNRFFAKTDADLLRIRERDRLKLRRCQENNVVLITIPQLGSMLKECELLSFISKEIRKYNPFFTMNVPDVVDLSKI